MRAIGGGVIGVRSVGVIGGGSVGVIGGRLVGVISNTLILNHLYKIASDLDRRRLCINA